jgi:hypothetical protein
MLLVERWFLLHVVRLFFVVVKLFVLFKSIVDSKKGGAGSCPALAICVF